MTQVVHALKLSCCKKWTCWRCVYELN